MKDLPFFLTGSGKASLTKILLVLAMLLVIAQPAFARGAQAAVLPPGSRPYGKTINAWTAEWWKYVMAFPASTNPLADPTGADCAAGQSGRVFFLVGTTGATAVRNECVVPVGKAILFPAINVIAAVPEDGATAEDIQSLATWFMDFVDRVEVTVDGVAVPDVLSDYRFASPIFSFHGATPGVFAPYYEGHREIAFSDGWWVMLAPLTPGPHTIHFLGHLFVPEWNYDFAPEVTYNIVVQ
ncbi:MAG: hypothetical protein ACM3QS_02245 [Bacteroidota bacterium]